MQRSNHSSISSSVLPLTSVDGNDGSEHKHALNHDESRSLSFTSAMMYNESPFGSAHETTLSSLSEPVVFRGIHPSFQLGDNNGSDNHGNGMGHGGHGAFDGDSLFDQSSLWSLPSSSSSLSHGHHDNGSDKMALPSLSMTAVTMKQQSSYHRAHEPSMDDSLDGLISSSLSSSSASAASSSGSSLWHQNTFGETAKELFVTVTPLAAQVSLRDDCPSVPVYVERYNSFTVSRRAVLEDIVAHLVATGVDHSVHDHKIRGLVYPSQGTGSCEFHVNRYKCDSINEWIIEVQRRAGCMFAFNQLYRSIVAATLSYHINTSSLSSSSLPSSLPSSVPLPSLSSSSSASSMLPSVEALTVKQLTTMASSSAVEVARAGMESLAVLSSVSATCAAACAVAIRTASLPLLSLSCNMVATASAPTARAAADLVANLCGSVDGVNQSLSCSSLVTSLLNMLDAPSSLSLRDTKRHCARAIAAMATTDITGLRTCIATYDALPTSAFTAMAILERYCGTDDVSLRTCIDRSLIALRSV